MRSGIGIRVVGTRRAYRFGAASLRGSPGDCDRASRAHASREPRSAAAPLSSQVALRAFASGFSEWLLVCLAPGMWRQLAPLLAVVSMAVFAAGALVAATEPPPPLPVADINHALHIEREVACVDCHTGVESHAEAGVPSITICLDCHEGESAEELGGDANGALIAAHLERGEELWWPSVYRLPDNIVFSHRRHVVLGEIACEECHGDVKEATTLPVALRPDTLSMDGCMDCHARHGADLDCWTCHQ